MKNFSATLALLFSLTIFADEHRLVIGAEGGKGIAIVDPQDGNKVLWKFDRQGPVHDLHLLDGERLLTQSGGWTKLVEISIPQNKVVWKYDAATQNQPEPDAKKVEVHAFQRLADGGLMIAESGRSRIIEIDGDGKLTKQFKLDVEKSNGHSDTRLVRKLENGHYLVAHEAEQNVKEYDADGKVVWHFEVPLFGKKPARGHGPDAWGGKCFSATRRANGNTLIATGNGHSVIEVTPKKEIVWHLKDEDLPGITLAWMTNVHELANGNLIIGNCHAGPENPQLIEVTPEKKVVWKFTDFETFGNALANTLVIDGEDAKALRALLKK